MIFLAVVPLNHAFACCEQLRSGSYQPRICLREFAYAIKPVRPLALKSIMDRLLAARAVGKAPPG